MAIVHRSRNESDKEKVNVHNAQHIRNLLKQGDIEELPHGAKGHRNTVGYVYINKDKPWKDFVSVALDSNEEEIGDEDDDTDDSEERESMTEGEAKYVSEITVIDPDSKLEVTLAVFKDQVSGGMFAIDSSFLDSDTLDERGAISSPFDEDVILILTGID